MKIPKLAAALGAAVLAFSTAAAAQALGWKQMPGAGIDIGVGPKGEAWVIGTNPEGGSFGIYRLDGANWTKIPGGAVRIDVGPSGPWVVNHAGGIYRWNGSGWTQVPGGAKDIGIGANGKVWVIGGNAEGGGFDIYRRNASDSGWDKIPGSALRIDVDPQGNAWVVNNQKDIYRWNGSSFTKMPGQALDIGIGANGAVYVVGTDNGVWQWTGSTWTKRDGALTDISVDHQGNPWGINASKNIWASGGASPPPPTPTPAGPSGPTGAKTGTDLDKLMQYTRGPALSKPDAEAVFGWIARRVQSDRQSYCYKTTDPRGVGTIPTTCSGDKENQAGLCYNKCKPGYYGVGPVCWQSCPSGYTDTGAICHYSARALTTTLQRVGCHLSLPFVGCTIPKMDCPTGYVNAGLFCAVKPPPKPPGMSGTDLDPMKDSYGRGAGTIPDQCPGGQWDAGLCYRNCKAGHYGVGPVCWQSCGTGKTDCAAGCAGGTGAAGAGSCAMSTTSMVMGPVQILGNLVSAGTFGTVTNATIKAVAEFAKAPNMVIAVGNAGYQAGNMTYVWVNDYVGNFAQYTSTAAADGINKKFSPDAARWVKQQYALVHMAMMTEDNAVRTGLAALSVAGGFDPTGVVATASAFAKPMCMSDEPVPNVTARY